MRTIRCTARIGPLCLTGVLIGAQTIVVFAQTSTGPADLARCAEVERDVARLACFDALAREHGQQTGTERAAPEATGVAPAETLTRAENEDAFGAELLDERDALGPDEIESRFIGEFTGWRGNTTFALENGQVWRQAEEGRLVFRSAEPLVTIRRGAFGTYRLTVEGVNRSVRVRRVE
ncbi:MAG: hypothetical protein HKN84_13335 [Gammaproteobacteria bacterium]|nr:hypothetical protein [Gammaproteobacteria bacterium]